MSIEWWQKKATKHDISDPLLIEPLIRRYILKQIGEPKKLLDIGCANGHRISKIARRLKDTQVIGIDVNDRFLNTARARYAKLQNIMFILTPFQDLNDTPEFDAVTCTQLLQHLPDNYKQLLLRKAAGKLKTGGVFLFQFVEGDTDAFLQNDTTLEKTILQCNAAGLTPTTTRIGLGNKSWVWITAIKGRA